METETNPPAPAAPGLTKIWRSGAKAGKASGFMIAGGFLASWLCGKYGTVCTLGGGQEVIAGTIAGLLYGLYDYAKRKAPEIFQGLPK